jgi:hypothetical protein
MIEINGLRKLSIRTFLNQSKELKSDKYYEAYLFMRRREYFELFQFSSALFRLHPYIYIL